jgi:cytochrome c oxidase assembly protein subunit 15
VSAQQPPQSPAASAAPPADGGRPARWADVLLNPSARAMRHIAEIGVLAAALIIPTGAAVRLSQSGLGCTNWPDCTAHSLVATGATGDPLIHRWVEFGNRLVTVVIFVVAVIVMVAALRYRDSAGVTWSGSPRCSRSASSPRP